MFSPSRSGGRQQYAAGSTVAELFGPLPQSQDWEHLPVDLNRDIHTRGDLLSVPADDPKTLFGPLPRYEEFGNRTSFTALSGLPLESPVVGAAAPRVPSRPQTCAGVWLQQARAAAAESSYASGRLYNDASSYDQRCDVAPWTPLSFPARGVSGLSSGASSLSTQAAYRDSRSALLKV
eukprot:CAMPEP_0178421566 /NCGR_PEP_ID=MMETSP0689_2-20121128/26712_1 /TAXON_ID=160604 /ORGANISM="Amphidinium massartii, Strain CS-259" /LENGTH=177 /DNA_ID=CAMNT_0020043079 /DNA_START=132 /DNA_END=662 /DNA_ORIENTATION=+